MKKLIAAFDGLKYSDSTAAYSIEIATKHDARLIGVFLEDFTYHSYRIADLVGKHFAEEERAAYLNKKDSDTREHAVRVFQDQCLSAGIEFATHRDQNIAIQELLHESIYADLIVIKNNETLTHFTEEVPTNFIVNLLERTECAVMLIPPVYHKPEKFVFLYDGNPGSVFAMKQFAYLFPEADVPVELVCVRKNKEEKVLPDSRLIREWVKLHYPNAETRVLQGDPEDQIKTYLKEQTTNPLVVLGSYQRGSVSRLLHKSLADVLMKTLNLPLFIAHK